MDISGCGFTLPRALKLGLSVLMWIAYDQYQCSRIFERFVKHNLIDFLKNAVTLSIFKLEKCSLHQNGVEI